MIDVLLDRVTYIGAFALVALGLFVLVDDQNLLKKVFGLNIFQTGVFLFFISAGYRAGGAPPILSSEGPYVNPFPQVLMLTAIVVGVSVTAVALALIIRIHREYGTIREDELREVLGDE